MRAKSPPKTTSNKHSVTPKSAKGNGAAKRVVGSALRTTKAAVEGSRKTGVEGASPVGQNLTESELEALIPRNGWGRELWEIRQKGIAAGEVFASRKEMVHELGNLRRKDMDT